MRNFKVMELNMYFENLFVSSDALHPCLTAIMSSYTFYNDYYDTINGIYQTRKSALRGTYTPGW